MSEMYSAQKADRVSEMRNTQKVKRESRILWERVFEEDTQQFLDYYDVFVADHNKIYVDEEQGEAVSMLHRNPYQICMGDVQANVSYIVAVATKEEYRHQGRMKKLLLRALADGCREGEPFAYLMPASEKIYLPFGFRTVYYQNILTLGSVFAPVRTGGRMRAAESGESDRDAGVRAAESGESGRDAEVRAAESDESGRDAGVRAVRSGESDRDAEVRAAESGESGRDAGVRAAENDESGRNAGGSRSGVALICVPAEHEQLAELVAFSERVLSKKGVMHTKRDTAYYERIWKEQEAVNGGILLFYIAQGEPGAAAGEQKAAGRDIPGEMSLLGWCFTGLEDAAEVWELVLDTEDTSLYAQALGAVTEHFREALPVKVSGLLPGTAIAGVSSREFSWRPMTMVRITNLFSLAKMLCAEAPFACYLHIKDEWIPQNNGWFYLEISEKGGSLQRAEEPQPAGEDLQRAEKPQPVGEDLWRAEDLQQPGSIPRVEMTIEELEDVLFGIRRHLVLEAARIKPLHPLYFNELV